MLPVMPTLAVLTKMIKCPKCNIKMQLADVKCKKCGYETVEATSKIIQQDPKGVKFKVGSGKDWFLGILWHATLPFSLIFDCPIDEQVKVPRWIGLILVGMILVFLFGTIIYITYI